MVARDADIDARADADADADVDADADADADVDADADATAAAGEFPVDKGSGASGGRGVTFSSQSLMDCDTITLLRVTQLCGQNSDLWTPNQWVRARNAGGVHIFGTNITLDSCHVFNAAGIYIYFKATYATIRSCIIENFSSDGMNIKASNATVEHNIIVGAHKVDGNHNDLCQAWASANVVFRGNRLLAYKGLPGPLTARDVQGLGAYDGWKKNWVITDNLVATDHPIGIWLQGDDACIVGNNTVLRCGADLWFSSQPTSILLGPSKTGAVVGGSRLFNNLAEAYRLANARAVQTANQVLKPSARAATFVRPPYDVHLTDGATAARGKGSALALATLPSYDADGIQRPSVGSVDAGCYQYRGSYVPPKPTTPRAPTSVVPIPNLGYDVAWAPTGTRSVAITLYGRTVTVSRTGASTCFVFATLTPSAPVPPFMVQGVPDV